MFVSTLVFSVGMIYITHLTKDIIATLHHSTENYQAILNFYVFDVAIFVVFYFLHKMMYVHYRPRLYKFLADTLGEHVLYHNNKYFVQHNGGEIQQAIIGVCNALPEMLDFVYSVMFVVGALASSLIIACGIHWHIGCMIGVWMCWWALLNIVFGIRGARFTIQTTTNILDFCSNVSDVIDNIAQVRSVCAEESEAERIQTMSERVRYTTRQAELNFAISQTTQTFTFVCTEVLIYAYATELCRQNILEVAQVVQLTGMIAMLVTTLWSSARQIAKMIQDTGLYVRSIRLIGACVQKHPSTDRVILPGSITINALTFRHPEAGLFKDLNLRIAEGEKVGFVGQSGSGKTTLVNLIMGQERSKYLGEIMVGEVDIRSLTIRALRNCFAFVPQKITLFQRTVRDNIAYGTTNYTEEDMIEAAQRACAHAFITQLPQGYDTILSINGLELSGGQRQRLMLARALLRLKSSASTNILIIDEGTSALDNSTEREVKLAMTRAMEGKTAIVIAHRLSTLEQMDRIVVFDNGRIVEEGKHQDLLASNGKYQELWQAQLV
jgi:ATP-binding cassette subfamily B protein